MEQAQAVIGSFVRFLRKEKGLTLENLAAMAGISYQYLSGLENGKENFSIQVLEALSQVLNLPLSRLVSLAYQQNSGQAPTLREAHFRKDVPLPKGLSFEQLAKAVNHTQNIVHRINQNLQSEVGCTLQSLIQGNNFSGMVSNILSNFINGAVNRKDRGAHHGPVGAVGGDSRPDFCGDRQGHLGLAARRDERGA